jgi:hypothetical protein
MNMVIPDAGKLVWQQWSLGNGAFTVAVVSLFKSNTTVVAASVPGDFTIATFPGYADVNVSQVDWGVSAIVGGVAISVSATTPVYTHTGGASQLVYGWIMVDDVSGDILAGQNFDAPRNMTGGGTETLDPFQIGLQTLH